MIEEPERDWQPGDLPNISGDVWRWVWQKMYCIELQMICHVFLFCELDLCQVVSQQLVYPNVWIFLTRYGPINASWFKYCRALVAVTVYNMCPGVVKVGLIWRLLTTCLNGCYNQCLWSYLSVGTSEHCFAQRCCDSAMEGLRVVGHKPLCNICLCLVVLCMHHYSKK